MAFPKQSSLNEPQVQQALSSLGELSRFTAEVVQAEAQARGSGQGAAPGSGLNEPKVQQALQGLAQAQGQAALCTVKNALNGGELAPEMLARFDLPRYQLGCEKLLNMIPLASGGLTKRPGFEYVASAGQEGADFAIKTRLIPFVYSSEIQLMLLLRCNNDGSAAMLLACDRDGKAEPKFAGGSGLPYKGEEIFEVATAQCGKVIYMAHAKYPPGKLVLEDSGASFRYEMINFRNEVPIPAIASLAIHGTPNPDATDKRYVVTAVSDKGEESYASAPQTIRCSALNSGFHCVVTVAPVPGCAEYRVYKQRGAEWGFIGRCTGGTLEFHDEGYAPDTLDPPPERQEFFAKKGDYPAIVFLHQQRLGFAASDNNPLTIWMSQTSNFECFASKTPPNDDDGLEVTLASTQANRILWCVSDRAGLAVGTSGEEWYLTGAGGEQGITPNSMSFQPQTRYGSESGLAPLRANSSLLFVQNGGKSIRDLGYSFSADRYEAQDLGLLARHLFRFTTISDWCWQGAPANILWIVLKSGKLIGLTYMPEHEVAAWHRHDTQGHFMSCATLTDSQGRPRLWVVAQRYVNGTPVYYVEMLGAIHEGLPGEWDHLAPETAIPRHLDGKARHEFKARCIPCLPEVGLENGATTMRVKKINAVKARVINSMPFAAQVISQNAPDAKPLPVPVNSPSPNDRLSRRGYTAQADWACPLGAGFRDGAKLELILDGPDPVTILGLAITMEVAREAGGQV